jgi:preprotein translocase subunit SecD
MHRSLFVVPQIVLLASFQPLAQTPAHAGNLIELRAVNSALVPGFHAVKSVGDTVFYVADCALLTDSDIQDATTDTSALNPGSLILRVRLTPSAAARLHEFTEHHIGDRLALLLNGRLSGTPPVIRDPISGQALQLEGIPVDKTGQFAAAVAARWHSPH